MENFYFYNRTSKVLVLLIDTYTYINVRQHPNAHDYVRKGRYPVSGQTTTIRFISSCQPHKTRCKKIDLILSSYTEKFKNYRSLNFVSSPRR